MSTGSPVAFTDEATSDSAGRTIYTITDRAKKYWSRAAAVTVKVDSSVVGASTYRIQHAGGKIHFFAARTEGAVVEVSGEYVAVTAAAQTREYSLNINSALEDVTTLDDGGFRKRLPTIVGASGTLSGFYDVNNLLQARLIAGTPLVVEMDPDNSDNSGTMFACYALLSTKELQAAVEGAVGATVSWESDGDILYEAK